MNFDSLRSDFEQKFQTFVAEFYNGQEPLAETVRYVLQGEGKRTRAILALLSARAFGAATERATLAAIAVEMVHAYSLVHDDMPCMDNDDLRRGRPTAHIKFDEAGALLAGDTILTDAFAVLASAELTPLLKPYALGAAERLQLVVELSHAAGSRGMALGQSLDMFWTKKRGGGLADLAQVHELKTGALIGAACAMGAAASGKADAAQIRKMREAGSLIGHAFQILDDLLDNDLESGKSAGKDRALEKLCYLKLMSTDAARIKAEEYTMQALAFISGLGEPGIPLQDFVQMLLLRKK